MDLKLQNDLEYIRSELRQFKTHFEDKTFLLTGATGFFGKWLLSAFDYLKEIEKMNFEVLALSRDPKKFLNSYPSFSKNIKFITGDIRNFECHQNVDYIIHAASDSNIQSYKENPIESKSIIVNGAKNLCKIALESKAKKILNISSGAVYGKYSRPIRESDSFIVNESDSSYSQGKRECENILNALASGSEISVVHARCFAFAGAFLPLDASFAIGNFVRDKLAGKDIKLTGDGSPLRSYMHPRDLVVWLLTLLFEGKSREAYNVGADKAVSIADIAKSVEDVFAGKTIQVENHYESENQYIPDITKAREELGLRLSQDFAQTVESFVRWVR